jgi:hypothetical protein
MLSDPELFALLEQASRNLDTLELLMRAAGQEDIEAVMQLRQRLQELKVAYRAEADALTRVVLERAVERRGKSDRRRQPQMQTAT